MISALAEYCELLLGVLVIVGAIWEGASRQE
jgi:hypothetical protein